MLRDYDSYNRSKTDVHFRKVGRLSGAGIGKGNDVGRPIDTKPLKNANSDRVARTELIALQRARTVGEGAAEN